MLPRLPRIVILILVGAGLLALPSAAIAGDQEVAGTVPATAGESEPWIHEGNDHANDFGTWFYDWMLGLTPEWLEEWLKVGTEDMGPDGLDLGTDRETDVVEPRFGGVDDPAGPWA